MSDWRNFKLLHSKNLSIQVSPMSHTDTLLCMQKQNESIRMVRHKVLIHVDCINFQTARPKLKEKRRIIMIISTRIKIKPRELEI